MALKEKNIKSPLSIKNINLTIHNKDNILFNNIINSFRQLGFFIYFQLFSTTDPRTYVHKYN